MLGPLLVVDGDRVVALGGPMQRGVLALLVLEPNRVVSMRQLIDGLWRDDPPVRATGTVQAYVSNLRRVLEPGRRPGEPARVLVWRAPGYVLRVAPEDVDWLLRFERLVDQARVVREAGDLLAAEAMLAETRVLWRGPALADLVAVAVRERARLDGLRLGVVEDHAEVRLALGRHDEVVDDLAVVAGEHPLRERLRGLQMIALYRAGRQVEALEVYTEVRRRLAEARPRPRRRPEDPAGRGGRHRGRRAGLPGLVGPLRGRRRCTAVVALGADPARRRRRPGRRRVGTGACPP